MKWYIKHPGYNRYEICNSFEEAMKLFEGFNNPFILLFGIRVKVPNWIIQKYINKRIRKKNE